MQVTLMHNPKAGSGKPSSYKFKKLFKKSGYDLKYQSTKKKDYKKALENPGEAVIVAGGDGTIGKVAKNLVGRDLTLGIIPIGTANNFAKTLNILESPKNIIKQFSTYFKKEIDVGEIKGVAGEHIFIESIGLGLFPELMMYYKKNPKAEPEKRNKEKEVKEALLDLKDKLSKQKGQKCKISIDGEIFSDHFLLLEVMNIKTMGPNLPLAAEADPGDGYFDIVMVLEKEREAFISYLDDYIEGKTPALDLTVRRGQHIQIFWDNFTIHIDDELWPEPDDKIPGKGEKELIIDILIIPQALEVLVPGQISSPST